MSCTDDCTPSGSFLTFHRNGYVTVEDHVDGKRRLHVVNLYRENKTILGLIANLLVTSDQTQYDVEHLKELLKEPKLNEKKLRHCLLNLEAAKHDRFKTEITINLEDMLNCGEEDDEEEC